MAARPRAKQSCHLSSALQVHRRGAKWQGPFVPDPSPPFAGLPCLSGRGGKAASSAQSCPLGDFGRCLCLATVPKAPKVGADPSMGWVRCRPWANSSSDRSWSRSGIQDLPELLRFHRTAPPPSGADGLRTTSHAAGVTRVQPASAVRHASLPMGVQEGGSKSALRLQSKTAMLHRRSRDFFKIFEIIKSKIGTKTACNI